MHFVTSFTHARRRLLWLAIAGLALACSGSATRTPVSGSSSAADRSSVYPDRSWERISDPTTVGYSRAGLDSVRALLGTMSTTGLMVVVNGRVLLEHGDVQQLSYLASARKSILSMLYGNYVASGKLQLNKTLRELNLDDLGGLLPIEKEATVDHLLGARSGVYHAASNPGDNLADAPPRGSQKPGTYYLYSNWDFNALGTIFEQETGRNIYDALQSDLAEPLGFEDFRREIHRRTGDTTRSIHLAYHMTLSTRDMARVGYVMLRHGRWRDRQVIPREWVQRSTSLVTRAAEMNPSPLRAQRAGYGYLWWVWDGRDATGLFEGAYSARGAFGQYITVIPKLDMVVAHKVAVPPERFVSGEQYEKLLDAIVAAKKR